MSDDGSPEEDTRASAHIPTGEGRGANRETARRHNLGTVLRHLHRREELSRSELTGLTWLNRSTIADLTGELETLGIAERSRPRADRVALGRPSAGVRLADGGPFVIAVDLTVDHATVARVGLGGRILSRSRDDIAHHSQPGEVAGAVAALVREVVAGSAPGSALLAVGVAVPGLVRRSDGLIRLAPNLGWHDVSFGSLLRAELGLDVSVVVGNEADLGALVEGERGAGVGVDDLLYISGRIGVGAGIIAGGRPLGGFTGYAGEVGHLQIDPAGLRCHCGSVGCWETLVGGHAIAAAIDCPPEDVTRLASYLDELSDVPPDLRRIAHDIGHGLGSIVNVFNPQLILLGGYFSSLFPHVEAEVLSGLSRVALPAVVETTTLAVPALAADAVLLGAAEIAFEGLLVDPVGSMTQAHLDAAASFCR